MDDIETQWKMEDRVLSYQPLPLEVSRGCIFRCAFCAFPFLGKKNYEYIRSSASIARELRRNYELFGTYRYTLSDDTFNDSWEKLDRLRAAIDLAGLDRFEFVGYIKPEILATNPGMSHALTDMGLRGAHLGIESFNSRSRQAIGKGMNIDRILDVTEELRSSGVCMYATFITGLPGETIESCYETNNWLCQHTNSHFQSWGWNALNITNHRYSEKQSLFERNPQAYGYTVTETPGSDYYHWINDCGVTLEDAVTAEKILNGLRLPYCKIAGWLLAAAWYHDIPPEDILNKNLADIRFYDISESTSKKRCLQELSLLTAANR
jgi:radical SAM superfamily enzyme YgiQ (UPF0313 family)